MPLAKPETNGHRRFLQGGLTLLLVLMILEGLLRKVLPSMSIVLYFAKYLLTLLLGVVAVSKKLPPAARMILLFQSASVVGVLPCFYNTLLKDPVLAVFGMMQYCLFPFVGVVVCAAFLQVGGNHILAFLRLLACSLLVTVGVALIQNHLPTSHWLNQSIDGTDLNAFSAGGRLRVSSTFAFVAQYCIYLNAMAAILIAHLALNYRKKSPLFWLSAAALVIAFLVGTFITGSRSAVLGSVAVIAAGLSAALFTRGRRMVGLVFALMLIAAVDYLATHALLPESFSAYEARTHGGATDHNIEGMTDRLGKTFFGWTSWCNMVPFFGNGIGIESNGSEKFSAYAKMAKAEWGWMESDQSAVLFEGGIYLMLVWYGFRLFIILYSGSCLLGIRDPKLALASSFSWGFVAATGSMANLSTQAPAAIWWWLNVGLILTYRELDRSSRRLNPSRNLPWKKS